MKETRQLQIDGRCPSAENGEPKGKRMLVLFLFGLAVLIGNLRPVFFKGRPGATVDPFSSPTGRRQLRTVLDRSAAERDAAARLAFVEGRPMPVNSAGPETLTMLPGIGPRLAERIFSYRIEHGGFTGPEMLQNVEGIGLKKVRRLSGLVSFEP